MSSAKWSERVFTAAALGPRRAGVARRRRADQPRAGRRTSEAHEADFDFFIFFSFRYYHAFHGARAVPAKAILVPTAERDGALGLGIFPPVFRGIRALMYNSFEERALIQRRVEQPGVPGVVVGVGSDIPERTNGARFRQKFDLRDRFAIYVGRIDENKGCGELFEFFQRYSAALAEGMHLVLIGKPIIPIPEHPRIHHLGFVDDQDKFDALAAAELLIMPSYLESLSMVALEAWALGKPVLANARCDVLKGQCIRSNGGLYYETSTEFVETLRAIDFEPGAGGGARPQRPRVLRAPLPWPIIEQKYLDMLERLRRETPTRDDGAAARAGWRSAARSLPPADEVVKQLPTGPYRSEARSQKPKRTAAAAIDAQPPAQPAAAERAAVDRRRPLTVSRVSDRGRRGQRRSVTAAAPIGEQPARRRARPDRRRRTASVRPADRSQAQAASASRKPVDPPGQAAARRRAGRGRRRGRGRGRGRRERRPARRPAAAPRPRPGGGARRPER